MVLFAQENQSVQALDAGILSLKSTLDRALNIDQVAEKKLKAEEILFKKHQKKIEALKNQTSFVATIKFGHQYQAFQSHSNELQALRSQKKNKGQQVKKAREALLQALDQKMLSLKNDKPMKANAFRKKILQLSQMYEIYHVHETQEAATQIDFPQELDPEKRLALEDILVELDQKIEWVQRDMKHLRRKQFIANSMLDAQIEESFFSEGQFIHSGNIETQNSELDTTSLRSVNDTQSTESTASENSGMDIIPEASIANPNDLIQMENILESATPFQRSIAGIEAKRTAQYASQTARKTIVSMKDLEEEFLQLKNQRIKIIDELKYK